MVLNLEWRRIKFILFSDNNILIQIYILKSHYYYTNQETYLPILFNNGSKLSIFYDEKM